MQTVAYRDNLLPYLARLANRHLGLLTPGWELTEHQLASVLRAPLHYGPYFREEPQPGATEIVCAMDGERLVATAAMWLPERSDPRWSDGRLPGDRRDEAELLWLLSDPGSRGGLRTLLEAASRRAAGLGCRRVTAGDVCGVCPARYGVPASWTHLGAGLGDHGFAVKSQSAMMQSRLPDRDALRFHEAMGFSVMETGTTYRKDGLPRIAFSGSGPLPAPPARAAAARRRSRTAPPG